MRLTGILHLMKTSVPLKLDFDASLTRDVDEDSVTYRWDFNDGKKAYTLSPRISHTFPDAGNYIVTLITSDKWGGIDTVQHSIDVFSATDISNTANPGICVYPNPAYLGFHVEIPDNSLPAFLSMTDMNGRKRRFGIDYCKNMD